MLLVTSQHHFAISFQTKPGFYSGIPLPPCVEETVPPSISLSVPDWSKSQTICHSKKFSVGPHLSSEQWYVKKGFWLFLEMFVITLICRPWNIHNSVVIQPPCFIQWRVLVPTETISTWRRPFLMLLFNLFLMQYLAYSRPYVGKETKILVHNKKKIYPLGDSVWLQTLTCCSCFLEHDARPDFNLLS